MLPNLCYRNGLNNSPFFIGCWSLCKLLFFYSTAWSLKPKNNKTGRPKSSVFNARACIWHFNTVKFQSQLFFYAFVLDVCHVYNLRMYAIINKQ